jgi:hypothetical protein
MGRDTSGKARTLQNATYDTGNVSIDRKAAKICRDTDKNATRMPPNKYALGRSQRKKRRMSEWEDTTRGQKTTVRTTHVYCVDTYLVKGA